jgi:hypothetical protein
MNVPNHRLFVLDQNGTTSGLMYGSRAITYLSAATQHHTQAKSESGKILYILYVAAFQ